MDRRCVRSRSAYLRRGKDKEAWSSLNVPGVGIAPLGAEANVARLFCHSLGDKTRRETSKEGWKVWLRTEDPCERDELRPPTLKRKQSGCSAISSEARYTTPQYARIHEESITGLHLLSNMRARMSPL